ncbi:MAG: T9SS type A sorting domain-containing protein [Calditrichia bacterium]|nr:T9SS type A sorting domain-containing protein [Calditrichia bacterium]
MKPSLINLKILFYILIIIKLSSGQDIHWNIIGEMPIPTSGAQAFVHDSLIYILGGQIDSSGIPFESKLIQVYNPITDSWSTHGNMLQARSGFTGGIYDDELYYCGGVYRANEPISGYFSIENWDFNNAPTYYNYNYEFNRLFPTGLVHNENLYIFGGITMNFDTIQFPDTMHYLIEYNIPTNEITYKEMGDFFPYNLPYSQMSAILGDDIFIFGGVDFGISRNIYKFNTITHEFSLFGEMSGEIAGGAAVPFANNKILIIGGFNENSDIDALDIVSLFHLHDNNNYSFEHVNNLNYNRSGLCAVNYYGKIYVFGGFNENRVLVPQVEMIDLVVSIPDSDPVIVATNFTLYQNYPNPFNSTTNISFNLKKLSKVEIEIYSSIGQKVATIYNRHTQPGSYNIRWDGQNNNGQTVSSGIYFYKLSTQNNFEIKKMVLIK